MADLKLKVRYARETTDSDVPCREENFDRRELDWSIPVDRAALVLVDCWEDFGIASVNERANRIGRERIAPVVQACRRAGVTVVHAPSPWWAGNYPQWLVYAGDDEFFSQEPPREEWPPEAFRRCEGEDASFRVPRLGGEPRFKEWRRQNPNEKLRMMSCLGPEPGDYVVASGGQLHRLCRVKRILHLFYVGFATNICIQFRDYGMRPMSARGYNVVLLRDCTTAIEHPHTLEKLWLTEAAILNLEIKVGTSTTSEALRLACDQVVRGPGAA